MRAPLTPGQLALLQRISHGTDRLTTADSRLAVSVYALRSRRLVWTKSQRSYWSATITDEGRSLLERIQQPSRDDAPAPDDSDAPRQKRDVISISAVELVRRLEAADGELRVKNPSPSVRSAWRRALHAARQSGVLDGVRLRHSGRDSGDLVIQLVPTDTEIERPAPRTVRLPARLGRPHPIVAATRDIARPGADGWIDTTRRPGVVHLRVTRQNLTRVLRIAHAIFREATDLGHRVETGAGDRDCAGGAVLAIGGQRFELTFAEQTRRVPHAPTAEEEARARSYEWAHIRKWDYIASGRVTLRLGHTSDGKLAADGERWRLEDRLGHVLDGLEDRARQLDAAAEAHAAAEHERLERERTDWEEAMQSARSRLIESNRIDHLADQIRRWDEANKIRTFVAAARAKSATPECVEPKADEWLTWVSDYADTIDPLLGPLYMPEAPQATPTALERFLDGWSAYGPTRTGRR